MRRIILLSIFVLIQFTLQAQIPAGYYDDANGSGFTLKTNLHNIINGHTSISYGSVWQVFDESDIDPKDGFIWDIYSEIPNNSDATTDGNDPYNYTFSTNQCGNFSGEGSCYNREHSVPASWFDDASPMFSDVHHLFPTDGSVNGRRSNFPYGEVGNATFTSMNGSQVGSARSGLGYSGTVFEPIDEFKGDIARVYFYMATRYQNVIQNWDNNSANADAALNGTSDQVFEDWVVNMLLDWHLNDPVTQKEITRNDAIFDVQGNRNPFIDHPEYASSIWGSCEGPNNAPQSISFTEVTGNSLTINFNGGDGDGRLILVKEGSAVNFVPVNGQNYAMGASNDFTSASIVGDDNRVISTNGSTSVSITNLSSETTYHFAVYEYCMSGLTYLNTALTGNQTTTNATSSADGTFDYEYLNFNEIVISTTGSDYEIIELVGIPNQSLNDLSIISLDENGEILNVFNLSSEVISSNGFWLAANSVAGPAVDEDYVLTSDFVNNTTTFLLVENFNGSAGDDLDSNNDGSLNGVLPWDTIIDDVAMVENTGENVYSNDAIGPDGAFLPAGLYRESDGCGNWLIHTFDSPPMDVTPRISNGSSCFTAYNGTAWTAGIPNGSSEAIVAGEFTGDLLAEELLVVSNGAIIVENGTLLEVTGDLVNQGDITIQSGGVLLTEGNISGAGDFTIIRNTTFDENTGRYSFVSSPITGGQISNLGQLVFEYDETVLYQQGINDGLDRYVAPTGSQMNIGQGYASAFTGILSFTGIPNTGNISVTVTKTDHSLVTASEESFEGFDLIGNPYPSAINLNTFLDANSSIEGSIWIWDDDNPEGTRGDDGDFITINRIGEVNGGSRNDWNGFIGATQGFFIQVDATASAGNYSVNFTNDMRESSNNGDVSFFRTQNELQRFKINLKKVGSQFADETLIGLVEEATLERDRNYDAIKFSYDEIAVYSLIDEQEFAIQGLPLDIIGEEISIGAKFDRTGSSYEFSIKELENVDEDIFLWDKITGSIINLKEESYLFASTQFEENERFKIFIGGTVTETAESLPEFDLKILNDKITITGLVNQDVVLQITDIAGREIFKNSGEVITSQTIDFNVDLHNDVIYILNIVNGANSYQLKTILR